MRTMKLVIDPENPDFVDTSKAKNRLLFREVDKVEVYDRNGKLIHTAAKPDDMDVFLARCR